jgi:nitric oxide reductase subunit B
MDTENSIEKLSPWWRRAVLITLVGGFAVLIGMSGISYKSGPPIPWNVIDPSGHVVFTGEDIRAGQQVFLKYGLMENGSIWGHGAYLGPDFSATYLHTLVTDTQEARAREQYQQSYAELTLAERAAVGAFVQTVLKQNRYDVQTETLQFTQPESASYKKQIEAWREYFNNSVISRGLPKKYITDPEELRRLTAFFAWTAWASVAKRPGKTFSYTNNFPYDPGAGNTLTTDAILWSALSIIGLLGGTAAVLFAFGKFNYLGWKGVSEHVHPHLLPGAASGSQRATIKYFIMVSFLLLAQVLVGGALAHYRADPGSFYGFDLTVVFPSQILRTWHLQLAIFWIASAFVAGGLFFSVALGGREPRGQVKWINLLFCALVLVVGGSLLGELLGVRQLLGNLWFWFGHQGWEYLDLGRAWQVLLAGGLVMWLILLFRSVRPALTDPVDGEISSLFLYAAATIPLFYLPAFFFGSTSSYTVVDTWRFWIIHLWVEGFFELFVTVMVAVLFYKLGIVSRLTATRVIYLDAILFLGGGIVGTGHHWYWTGQTNITMALSAVFSALEVVPLILLTRDAWDFIRLTRTTCDVCKQRIDLPHQWTFYFLMAVGFWNFVGAGIFGFLINMPIISYFEVGTILTPNHGHAALMGAFGMLAVSLIVFSLRQVLSDEQWKRPEKYVRVSFWGLNCGLLLMVIMNLFPAGVLQLFDVLNNGYWHARGPEYLNQHVAIFMEWFRMPADLIFIILGVIPLCIATTLAYKTVSGRDYH